MQRTVLFVLGLLWLTAAAAFGQIAPKAQAVLDRYKQVTGTEKPLPDTVSMLMQIRIVSDTTVVSQIKLIKGSKAGCYRAEMNVTGKHQVLIVADGQTGWMIVDTLFAKEIPQEQVKLLASTGDMTAKMPIYDSSLRCVYVGQKAGDHVLKGELKHTLDNAGGFFKMFFSVETGLMTKIETHLAKRKEGAVIVMPSAYQKIGTMCMPTRMEVCQPGKPRSVIEITRIEFHIPTEPLMFAKPDGGQ